MRRSIRCMTALSLMMLSAASYALPQRIISLAPNATEFAYAAGMGEQMIAASEYSDYPFDANNLERVASWQGLNVERILALKPDLILAWHGGNPQRQVDQLEAFGIEVVYVDVEKIDDVETKLIELSKLSKNPQQALDSARDFKQKKEQLSKHYQHQKPYKVLLQFGLQPLFTSNGKSLQSQAAQLCNAKNIFEQSPVPWPQVSREQVLIRHPDAIVMAGNLARVKNAQDYWQAQLNIPVIVLDEDQFNRPGPRILYAASSLCKQLENITK